MSLPALSDVLMALGALWFVLAAVGMVRFTDAFARMHAGTKASTLGVALVVAGSAVEIGGPAAAKAALAIVLAFLTIPLGSHLIGRAVRTNPGAAHLGLEHHDTPTEEG